MKNNWNTFIFSSCNAFIHFGKVDTDCLFILQAYTYYCKQAHIQYRIRFKINVIYFISLCLFVDHTNFVFHFVNSLIVFIYMLWPSIIISDGLVGLVILYSLYSDIGFSPIMSDKSYKLDSSPIKQGTICLFVQYLYLSIAVERSCWPCIRWCKTGRF